MISVFGNTLGNKDLQAVKEVFDSKILGYGEKVKKFEDSYARKINSRFALGTANCTSAIYIALKLLNLTPNDEVVIPSIHFIGAINAILMANAKPVIADVCETSLNLTVEHLAKAVTKKTKAVVLLHYGGNPCDFDQIQDLCKSQNIKIVEDSANSPFSKYKGQYCGTLGEFGCVSFDMNKILVTGEGGMLFFQDKSYLDEAFMYTYHGFDRSSFSGYSKIQFSNEWWNVNPKLLTLKFSMNNISAAIGLEQLKKVDKFIKTRKDIWGIYCEELENIDLKLPELQKDCNSSYYFFWCFLKDRTKLANYLKQKNIYSTFKYYPLHRIKLYSEFQRYDLPNAEKISETCLNLPLNQNLTESEVSYIIETVKSFF